MRVRGAGRTAASRPCWSARVHRFRVELANRRERKTPSRTLGSVPTLAGVDVATRIAVLVEQHRADLGQHVEQELDRTVANDPPGDRGPRDLHG